MEKILLWVVLLASITRYVNFYLVLPDPVYYGIYLGSFIWLIIRGGIEVRQKYVYFILAIIISVWVNDIPALFKVHFRMLAFFSLTLLVGPFIINDRLIRFRRLLFIRSLLVLRVVIIISFVLKFIAPAIAMNRSGFCGLTFHSMVLSPISGICLLYSLYRLSLATTNTCRAKEMVYIGISFLVLLLSGSRGALGATLAASAFYYIRLYRNQMGKLLKISAFVSMLALSTSSIWWPYTERVRQKMESNENAGGATSSRDRIWQDRMDEFKAFPIFGVGFSSYNLDYVKSKRTVNKKTGTLEPGSSWLFLLSSLGLFGFLALLLPFAYAVYTLYKNLDTGFNGGLLSSILVLFAVHMFVEGYITAAGVYLCLFLWLSLAESEHIIIQIESKKQLSV